MLQMILGLQAIVTFIVAAKLLDNATGIGFFASVIFGGIPAVFAMGALLAMFPRSMLVAGTAFWLATGYGLGTSVGAEGATMAALLLVSGGLGFAANFTLATQGFELERKIAAEGAPGTAWKSPRKRDLDQSGLDLDLLAKGVARLFDHQVIAPATYGRVSNLLPSHGKVPKVDPTTEAGSHQLYFDLAQLADHNLLSPEEEAEGRHVLDQLTGATTSSGRSAEEVRAEVHRAADLAGWSPRSVEPRIAHNAPAPLSPEGRKLHPSDSLATLLRCRALPLDAYARAMLRVDPTYDVRLARMENFDEVVAQPIHADLARELYTDGVLTLADLQGVLDVVQPRKSA